MNNPCYKCVERVFGCHAGCSKYIAWRSEHTALREAISREKHNESALDGLAVKAADRRRRK